jgi:hypothetical protein
MVAGENARFGAQRMQRDQFVCGISFQDFYSRLQLIFGGRFLRVLDIFLVDVCWVSADYIMGQHAPVATNPHRGRDAQLNRGYMQQQPVPLRRLAS